MTTPIYQILGILFSNLVFIIYQGNYRPLAYGFENNIELVNEFIISMATLHIILFTDFVPEKEMQYYIGMNMLLVISLLMILNLYLVIYFSTWTFCLFGRKYYKLGKLKHHNYREHAVIKDIRVLQSKLSKQN